MGAEIKIFLREMFLGICCLSVALFLFVASPIVILLQILHEILTLRRE